MFKSCIANVGSMMKHTVYFTMFLLSSIIGIFFMYLGATGSWDAVTILMSMMGVMATCCLYFYLVVYIHPWCRETLIEAKRFGLICTGPANRPVVPTWADGDPRFDANASKDPAWWVRARFNPRDDAEYVAMARTGRGYDHPTYKAFKAWNDEKKAVLSEQMDLFKRKMLVLEMANYKEADYQHLQDLYTEASLQWRTLLEKGIKEQRFAYARPEGFNGDWH